MRRADRLFRIVQLLRSRRLLTAERLAEELGVSKRTIYRDIDDLRDGEVPIRGEAGVGYVLERGFELPPMTFTTAELEALVLGARVVQAWADPELAEAAKALLHKVEAVVPPPMRAILADTRLFVPDLRRDGPEEALGPLRGAVSAQRRVRFLYERADGAPSHRAARPLGLYFFGRTWLVAAWCELREDYRTFRVDRMAELEVLERFETDDAVSLERFLGVVRAEHGAR